jgi:hypothetical protein
MSRPVTSPNGGGGGTGGHNSIGSSSKVNRTKTKSLVQDSGVNKSQFS